MIVAVLGILKAGGAYVPLEAAYPTKRLGFILGDSDIPIIVAQQELMRRLPEHGARAVCIDTEWNFIAAESEANPRSRVTPNNLAYVIYTSGSTGKPKGVELEHEGLCNLVDAQRRIFGVGPQSRVLQFASLSFDVSFQEMFSTWCAGGLLLLVPEEIRRDAAALWRLVSSESVERLFLPFVALQHLAEAAEREGLDAPTLSEVITAGEQLQITPQIARLFADGSRILQNQYGPSESHVVTAFTLTGSPREWPSLPPIGRPIANTRIYLLDQSGQPVAIGVAGEPTAIRARDVVTVTP